MTVTKRVDELEVGDVVIFPLCKDPSTILYIERIEKGRCKVVLDGILGALVYSGNSEVTLLHSRED